MQHDARLVPLAGDGPGGLLFSRKDAMIWDCFMAGGSEAEIDIWECRFRELENIPNLHHVIVEAEVTHRGDPKPLWFQEYANRFARGVSGSPTSGYPQTCSRRWRRTRTRGAGSTRSGSTAAPAWTRPTRMTSCCTATRMRSPAPARSAVGARTAVPGAVFQMRLCMYAADWLHPLPWHGTIRTRYRSVGSFASCGTCGTACRHHGRRVAPVMDGRHRSAPGQTGNPLPLEMTRGDQGGAAVGGVAAGRPAQRRAQARAGRRG